MLCVSKSQSKSYLLLSMLLLLLLLLLLMTRRPRQWQRWSRIVLRCRNERDSWSRSVLISIATWRVAVRGWVTFAWIWNVSTLTLAWSRSKNIFMLRIHCVKSYWMCPMDRNMEIFRKLQQRLVNPWRLFQFVLNLLLRFDRLLWSFHHYMSNFKE